MHVNMLKAMKFSLMSSVFTFAIDVSFSLFFLTSGVWDTWCNFVIFEDRKWKHLFYSLIYSLFWYLMISFFQLTALKIQVFHYLNPNSFGGKSNHKSFLQMTTESKKMITPQSSRMVSASHSHVCTFIKSQNYNGTKTRVFIIPFPLSTCSLCFTLQNRDLGIWARQKLCIPARSWMYRTGHAELQGSLQGKYLPRLGHSLKKEFLDSDLCLIQD